VVKKAGSGTKDAGNAVVLLADLVIAALELVLAGVVHKAADEQIEFSIVVVVEPDGAGGPSGSGEAGFLRDVGEGPVMIVFVQRALAIGGDEDVGPAVIVVVADSHAHAEGRTTNAGFFGDVCKGPIAIVLVERVSHRLCRLPEIAGAAIHQEDVHPPVVVEVEKSTAGTQRLGQVVVLGHRVVMDPGHSARRGQDFSEERGSSGSGTLPSPQASRAEGGC
jgi:hypothetical protein